ncbi:BMP family ABC transporter substrate-binding protein [Micrococcales bacterium 31B]|nr:BMP family ABC transporter substrate-binding protein [Micrococcales bacterium 31B]
MKKLVSAAAMLTAATLALGACAAPPPESSSSNSASASTSGTAATTDFKGCLVSDSGGFDDKSFNQSAKDGMEASKTALGIQVAEVQSKAEADYDQNLAAMKQQNCNIIVTVGFNLAAGTGKAAQANPGTKYAIIDSTASNADGSPLTLDNVKPILFDTAQASYLAGYLAAGMSKTGTVATYGGMKLPSVTIFMDGFADGVAKYNADNGKTVKVLGWDKAAQNGSFVGDFKNVTQGKQLTSGFISQGADIIMPVAGPVGGGTLAAAKEKPGTMVIWVDADGTLTNPSDSGLILTSVMKQISPAVQDVVKTSSEDSFDNTPYVGTLENGGVGLAPYHDFDSQVPADLKAKVEQLQKDIIAGTIKVESASTPK